MISRLGSALLVVGLLAGCGSGGVSSEGKDSAHASKSQPAQVDVSDCAGTHVALDIPGPGRSTPEQAVAPYAKGTPTTVKKTSVSAVVHDLSEAGVVLRIFEVSKHEDGWWPDGYAECTH